MVLNQLPVEIIPLITNSILGDTETLANLVTCTKRLHQIVTPIPYSDITVRYKVAPISMWDDYKSSTHENSVSDDGLSDDDLSDDDLSESLAVDKDLEYNLRDSGDSVGTRQIRNLTRTILTRTILHNPQLASPVRSLGGSGLFHAPWIDGRLPQLDTTKHQSIIAENDHGLRHLLHAVEALKRPEETMDCEQWSDFCRRWQDTLKAVTYNVGARLAVLLAQLPALRTLKLDTIARACVGFTLPLLHHFAKRKDLSGAGPVLGSLTRLHVNCPEFHSRFSQLAAELLTIPTLSHFLGKSLSLETTEQNHHERNRPFRSLAYLQLMECCLDPHAMAATLRQCVSVQSFAFECSWKHDGSEVISTSELVNAMHSLHPTLKSLFLSYYTEVDFYVYAGPVNSVKFQVLTTLHIAAKYLVGDYNQNLVEFEKIDYETWVINASIPLYKRLPESLQVFHIMIPDRLE